LDQTQDQEFPDERRQGIETLVDTGAGKREPYTGLYMRMARDDTDYLVRATAIRALNRARWSPATGLFVAALDDPSELVRLEACKALVHQPDSAAIPGLLRLVSSAESSIDVRIAAADALQHYRQIEVARTLVAQLNDRDFGVAWQAHQSLRTLTGRDLQYSEGAWLNYLTGPDRPLG
jgi:HEAT repeat protein